MPIQIGGNIDIGGGIDITSEADLTYYNLLSPTGQAAWNAVGDDQWFRVDFTDYNAVRSGLAGIVTAGNTDAEINASTGIAGTNGQTIDRTRNTIAASNYIMGLSVWNTQVGVDNATWTFRPYVSTVWLGTYSPIGGGVCDTGANYNRIYFLRKNPQSATAPSGDSYVALGPKISQTGFGVALGFRSIYTSGPFGPAFSSDMSNWSTVTNNTGVSQQWLATPTRQW